MTEVHDYTGASQCSRFTQVRHVGSGPEVHFTCNIFDLGDGVCRSVIQEVVDLFLQKLIVSIDFADAIDPICSIIAESIARI